ncbi:MAG TPA: ABC transporter permease subunit [Candidatus Limnocylindrales bacterium]|nr:ABC transporter permease subunit [Candidatus Limnocylindrales bacterium]
MSRLDAMLAVAGVTARALLGRRRSLLMLLLAGAPVLLALLVRLGGRGSTGSALVPTLEGLLVTTILPLVALVFGTAALGSELDDGTGVHILTKPIPRWAIVVPKLVVAGGLTAILLAASTLLTGILLGGGTSHALEVTVAFAVAIAVGSFVYTAIFLALSAATSRGLLIGLGYSLLWEGLLAGALPGTQLLSVREYVRGIVSTLAPSGTLTSVVGAEGIVAAAVALVAITAIASIRLASYEVRASE